jgi:hypothetical protein
MNNLYTEIETLLTEHINEEFEISELADCPVLSVAVINGNIGTTSESLNDAQIQAIVERYHLNTILPSFGIDFTIIGYVCNEEFFLFAVFIRGEEHEMSPAQRTNFIELFNGNPEGIKLRHVPVFDYVLSLPGAKRVLQNGSSLRDVSKYTIQAIVEQCNGISPMTKLPRKGLVFKSLQSDFKFKVFSESYMLTMGDV